MQILTIAELLEGKKVQMPPEWRTFKRAQRIDEPGASQMEMALQRRSCVESSECKV